MASKFGNKLQLITFDATGTLIKFKLPPHEQYVKIGSMYGVEVSAKDVSSSFKVSWKQLSKEHPNYGKLSGLGWEKWWHELVCRTFRASVKSNLIETCKFDLIAHHLIDGYRSGSYYELYPHVKELLQFLQNKKIELGVISNNDDRLPHVIDNLGLLQHFSFILTSYDIGYEKPHCEIFQKALEYSNVLPEHAMHVGNNPKLDYLAAKQCGWNAVLVHPEDKISLMEQHPVIPRHLIFMNFTDLQHFLS